MKLWNYFYTAATASITMTLTSSIMIMSIMIILDWTCRMYMLHWVTNRACIHWAWTMNKSGYHGYGKQRLLFQWLQQADSRSFITPIVKYRISDNLCLIIYCIYGNEYKNEYNMIWEWISATSRTLCQRRMVLLRLRNYYDYVMKAHK